MADSNNPFGGYTEKNAGRTVQNVTSSMWEPISAGPSIQKDAPVRKSGEQKKKNTSEGKKPSSSRNQPQERKKKSSDVTRDRISEGGGKASRPSADKKKKTPDASKKKKASDTQKKKKSSEIPVGSKKREPKGRDTRNPRSKESEEKKNARKQTKSGNKAERKRRDGMSNDEMRNGKSKSTRLKAKIIAVATVIITLVVALLFLGVYVYQNGATVTTINIVGENRYKDEKITEVANVYVGINMLSVREKAVNEAVTKALPYIKDVQVEYRFPDTLVLNITPTSEKLLIAGSTGYICLDGDGKVLSLNKKKLTDGRYLVEGFEEQTAETGVAFVPTESNKEKYERAKAIVAALEGTGKFPKGVVNVANLDDVTVVYDSRINIYLGDCSRLEGQIDSAVNIIEIDEDIINGQTGYIETRYEGQTTFRPGSMQK